MATEVGERIHKKACHSCGGDMTAGQLRRQSLAEQMEQETMGELDSTYAHLRAVVENCKRSPVEAIRHQLVGLLPEVRTFDPDKVEELRSKGMGHLVDMHEERVREAWAEYGYPGPVGGEAGQERGTDGG